MHVSVDSPVKHQPANITPWLDYDVPHLVNPSQSTLRELTLANTPAVLPTSFGSLNKVSRNKARMAKYTFIITDNNEGWSHKTIAVTEARRLIDAQAAYIQEKNSLIEVQGWLGVGPRAVPVQWLYTIEGANIAAMQQILSFPRQQVESNPTQPFAPKFRVVYTPNFRPEVEGGQRILVDLDNYVTYVMGPDYFGESKKGALRMLCDHVLKAGGLVMHAGAKEVHLDSGRMTVAILGLSGTGKTTTTFSKQGTHVKPVQDDMVAIWPGGELSVTENGCFAKTFGLTEASEPVVWRGSTSRVAWLENAYQDASKQVDFFKKTMSPEEVGQMRDVLLLTGASEANLNRYVNGEVTSDEIVDADGVPADGWDFVVWTENGRSIVPLSAIDDAANLHDLAPVRSIGVLNRDEGAGAITPGIVRFTSPDQAAGYFMLGETTKTSAAGKDRGRIRSPFTQPFFPREHGLQAKRFAELLASTEDIDCWLMNTGVVGGNSGQENALKVKIRHSSAMLEAMFEGRIVWERDEDFAYDVVAVDDPANAALLELVPLAILRPDRHYAATGRDDTYREEVAERHTQRREFLKSFGVDPKIIDAVCL
jgi:phosphoenolpyruvate carboxykinase (ATP)